eukprot:3270855-Lingulodinium_polyedra.AAC.1
MASWNSFFRTFWLTPRSKVWSALMTMKARSKPGRANKAEAPTPDACNLVINIGMVILTFLRWAWVPTSV